ncbi:MAG: NADH-quinone oxidoreductase subunit G [Sphingobacteriia bacterium]|nr:NADH-quinone oxidoreductase subunit G [Sphingobacteriia bacterium]
MPKLIINGKEIEVENGLTLIQACEIAGVEIPRFCYHEKLKIAGNCRMCLVEMEKAPKPVASCAMPVAEGMVIHTDSPLVKKAREGVMEFLLINHPLDCPICDQGGECDLQDQAYAYGKGSNRFHENKRAVKDKYMGPLIKTHMTRCIHCTRCIRFTQDIAGVPELGAVGRGEHMEVTTYVGKAISSELSGNIIDLCPVGALTSKPYAFKARSWELRHTESIDVLDAVGSNIRIDARGKEVMRILPSLHEGINEEWISDKTRFACDGLKYQRLDKPYIKEEDKFKTVSWETALERVKKEFASHKPSEIGVIFGNQVEAESMFLMKKICEDLNIKYMDGSGDLKLDYSNRMSYLFNTTIEGIEQADLCLLIGSNPRYEASLINARIRKTWLNSNRTLPIASIGEVDDQTYPVEFLGNKISVLRDLISEKHAFSEKLKNAKKPIIIIGDNVLKREDSLQIQSLIQELSDKYNIIREDWNGYNVLHQAASRIAALDLHLVPGRDGKTGKEIIEAAKNGEIKLLYLLACDDYDLSGLPSTCTVIYQGHHGDNGAHNAHIILPGAAYTEKNGLFLNLEGRVQKTKTAVTAPNMAKEDFKILSDLMKIMGRLKPFESLNEVRKAMFEYVPHFSKTDFITPAKIAKLGMKGEILDTPISSVCKNYYMTDPISRASRTMAECARTFKKTETEAA